MIFLAVEAKMDANRSRRLNFDAPFLSTKRHLGEEKLVTSTPEASGSISKDIRERVPFCWEQEAGMPKNLFLQKGASVNHEAETPRLKLPPGRVPLPPPKLDNDLSHDHNDVHHIGNDRDRDYGSNSINHEPQMPCPELPSGRWSSQKPNKQVYDHVDCHLDDDDAGNNINDEADKPCPKLPSGRLPSRMSNHQLHDHDDCHHADLNGDDESDSTKLPSDRLVMPPQKSNGQVHDHNDDDGTPDAFSDAEDVLSLTQAIDIVEHRKTQKPIISESDHSGSRGYLTIDSIEHSGNLCPSYIIERFLPDAAALAASSAHSLSAKKLNRNKFPYFHNYPDKTACVSRAIRQSCFSPKLCGLQMLLPWRTKHRICGMKSSVRQSSHLAFQPKFSTSKEKK